MGGGYHGGFGKTKGAFDDVSCKTPAVKESGDILSEKMLISELEKAVPSLPERISFLSQKIKAVK